MKAGVCFTVGSTVGAVEEGVERWEINGGVKKERIKEGRREMVTDGAGGEEESKQKGREEREKCVHQSDLREKLGDCQAVHLRW